MRQSHKLFLLRSCTNKGASTSQNLDGESTVDFWKIKNQDFWLIPNFKKNNAPKLMGIIWKIKSFKLVAGLFLYDFPRLKRNNGPLN